MTKPCLGNGRPVNKEKGCKESNLGNVRRGTAGSKVRQVGHRGLQCRAMLSLRWTTLLLAAEGQQINFMLTSEHQRRTWGWGWGSLGGVNPGGISIKDGGQEDANFKVILGYIGTALPAWDP